MMLVSGLNDTGKVVEAIHCLKTIYGVPRHPRKSAGKVLEAEIGMKTVISFPPRPRMVRRGAVIRLTTRGLIPSYGTGKVCEGCRSIENCGDNSLHAPEMCVII